MKTLEFRDDGSLQVNLDSRNPRCNIPAVMIGAALSEAKMVLISVDDAVLMATLLALTVDALPTPKDATERSERQQFVGAYDRLREALKEVK